MPSFIRRAARFLGSLFRRKPEAPRVGQGVPGHRGIAAGRIAAPELTAYAERVARGHEEVSADQTEAFVNDQMPLFVMSTNVVMAQYFIE